MTAPARRGTPRGETIAGGRARKGRIRLQFLTDGERTAGIELVERLLTTGDYDATEVTPTIAAEAIEALEHLRLPWLVDQMVESGERFAEQIHSEATRGLQEVIQNADDQGALNIRFGFRQRSRGAELLVAHDGNPVEVHDVVRMAWPLLSGSREDPEKIGRFGIGLKTLNQFGERLGVHCPPLPGFEIRGGRIARIASPAAIKDFWDPERRETLFVLGLQDEQFNLAFFKEWATGWDVSSLLFLRGLQRVTVFDLNGKKVVGERGVTIGKRKPIALEMLGALEADQVTVTDLSSTRMWTRYSVQCPRPKGLKATHKELGETVRLKIAMPRRAETSRLFVGLPLDEPCDLPFSISAPFEPNVDRTHIRDQNKLNEWLIARVGDFAAAVTVHRFREQPRSGWRSLILGDEGAGGSQWAKTQFSAMGQRQRDRVGRALRLELPDGRSTRLAGFFYEPAEFEGVFAVDELEKLWERTSAEYGERHAVPKSWRDGGGRWRLVLEEIEDAHPLTPSECLTILDWPDDEIDARGAKWLVDVIYAARKAHVEDQLWRRRCIVLAEGAERLSPANIAEGGALLVHTIPSGGLSAALGLTQQIAPPFRARTGPAEDVRAWLQQQNVLQEKATDADVLRALARAKRPEPLDLSARDDILIRLRNSFEHLPADERTRLGPGIGQNIALSGYTFEGGAKVSRVSRPIDAYLPSAIDKNEGWPTAAAQTTNIVWIDRRYRDVLRGARGQGALAFLRALGAAVAPRLVPASPPTSNPHAQPLIHGVLCDQHRAELAGRTRATGFADDWVSPDLDAVVRDLMKERLATPRRKRARALFLALDRAWDDQYSARATARAVRHYYSWTNYGEVSATWVARLASQTWLSTRESRLTPAAPRDLTVLTEAAFEIEGERPERYVHEIDAEHVDSPLVDALRIQGRPFASSILERLERMRDAERNGEAVAQAWADRSYHALASYAPGGRYAEQSDLTARQLQAAFTSKTQGRGLIRVGGDWLPPSKVRRDPFLDDSLPRVSGAGALWNLLGISKPSIADCVEVVTALATRDETNPSSEIRVFRHLVELLKSQRRRPTELKTMPIRTYKGWRTRNTQPIFAVADPVLAEALGAHWDVWQSPLPIEEVASLVPALGLRLLSEDAFQADIPTHAAVRSPDTQAEFSAAVGHLNDYLAVHHPALHLRLNPSQWAALAQAHVIVGGGWGIRVRGPGKRALKLTVRAHLFEDPLRFCVLHEDEAAERDAGGQAIAAYFVGDQPHTEDRSTLALAWAYAFTHRLDERAEISLAAEEDAENAPPMPTFGEFAKKTRRQRGKVSLAPAARTKKEPPRELVDLTELDLADVSGTFLESKRRGTLQISNKTKLKEPTGRPDRSGSGNPAAAASSATRGYSDKAREDTAFRIVEAVLAETRGLTLEDTRSQPAVGADAVDRENDIWIELKTHGQGAADTLRLEPSEALRAEEKRGKYWLVVVWDLEKPRTPRFVVIPDPLRRLDTYLANGLRLSGVAELAAVETSAEGPSG